MPSLARRHAISVSDCAYARDKFRSGAKVANCDGGDAGRRRRRESLRDWRRAWGGCCCATAKGGSHSTEEQATNDFAPVHAGGFPSQKEVASRLHGAVAAKMMRVIVFGENWPDGSLAQTGGIDTQFRRSINRAQSSRK
jgi:hypothetical protein